MSKRKFKRIAAFALAATMAFGSTMTVFAEPEGEPEQGATAGVSTGTGSYEGGELKYPTLKVTLPTIPEGTYDYIADPNGLIELTKHEKYKDATFTGSTGVYFETSANTYSNKSAAQEVVNENAQNIDVTVKVEVTTPGDESIKYVSSAEFGEDDKTNGLYLAITDDAAENAQVSALSTSGVATITATVEGVPSNYMPSYSEEGGYGYKLKTEGTSDWNKCSFILTGALNKNATWGDKVEFPEIQITWSYEEHPEMILSSDTISSTSNVLTVAGGVTVTKVTLVKSTGAESTLTKGNHYNVEGNSLTFTKEMLGNNAGGKLKIEFSNGKTEEVSIVK